MKKTIFIMLIFNIGISYSQDTINYNNKKIIIFPDNTWQYFDNSVSNKIKSLEKDIDCSKYIIDELDVVSGRQLIASKDFILLNSEYKLTDYLKLLITIGDKKIRNELVLSFIAKGDVGCTEKNGIINILFTDGSRIELKNRDFNCKGTSLVYIGGIWGFEDELTQLKNKKIKTIRTWFTNKFIEKTLDKNEQETIFNTINCLLK